MVGSLVCADEQGQVQMFQIGYKQKQKHHGETQIGESWATSFYSTN